MSPSLMWMEDAPPQPSSHAHGPSATIDLLVLATVAVAVLAVGLYIVGAVLSARRGRPWPLSRVVLWSAGVACGAASAVGPLAVAAHTDFVAHMGTHLLGGMLAPLLLVLSAPVTLALRTLAVVPARRVSRLLRSLPMRVLAHPVTAGALSAGGLWLIYLSPVFEAMQSSALVHVVVHGHLLFAGFLFTAAVIGVDPSPHRPRRVLVAIVLVVVMASHGVLAKWLYANPPTSVSVVDAQQGAQFMYYAGALIEGAIIVIFCAQWYRAAGRRLATALPVAAPSPPRSPSLMDPPPITRPRVPSLPR